LSGFVLISIIAVVLGFGAAGGVYAGKAAYNDCADALAIPAGLVPVNPTTFPFQDLDRVPYAGAFTASDPAALPPVVGDEYNDVWYKIDNVQGYQLYIDTAKGRTYPGSAYVGSNYTTVVNVYTG